MRHVVRAAAVAKHRLKFLYTCISQCIRRYRREAEGEKLGSAIYYNAKFLHDRSWIGRCYPDDSRISSRTVDRQTDMQVFI